MVNYQMTTPLRRVKLAPQTLMPGGESISSLVDRQAQLWGVSRRDLFYEVASTSDPLAWRELDCCENMEFLDSYSQKTGIDRQLLGSHRGRRSNLLVSPGLRYAYCPICFHNDASAGRTPHFRLNWARILLTHCQLHLCPLFRWPCVSLDGTRVLPHGWFVGEGPDQPNNLHFQRDLSLAKAYACAVRPISKRSTEAWRLVVRFEDWMYKNGIGSPQNESDTAGSHETDIMRQAVWLSRAATANGRLQLEESPSEMFEDQRVMAFNLKPGGMRKLAPAWKDFPMNIYSLACRRSILFVIATAYQDVIATTGSTSRLPIIRVQLPNSETTF